MKTVVSILCGFFIAIVALSAQAPPVTTLNNAELFSRQYAQADTIEINFGNERILRESTLPNKRKLNSICIVKTAISGTLWGGVGLLAGGGMGAFAGGLLGVVLVGGPSTIVGISSGTYCSGRKYRKGEYWYSLVGTILPALTVAGVTALISDKNKYNLDATLYTFAFAPITSTAAYYIFSEELPDTVKQ